MTDFLPVERRPHSVYRIYDAADRLIYIGCTSTDVDYRIYLHMRTFGNLVSLAIRRDYARHTSVEYPTKAAARHAEREAIRDEAPLLNREHNPRRFRRVNGEYVPVEQVPA